jgi:hypothetical protein
MDHGQRLVLVHHGPGLIPLWGLLITAAHIGSGGWERMSGVVSVLPLVCSRGASRVWSKLCSGVRRLITIGRRERGEDGEDLGSVGEARGGWRQACDSEEQAAALCDHRSWAARPLQSMGACCD